MGRRDTVPVDPSYMPFFARMHARTWNSRCWVLCRPLALSTALRQFPSTSASRCRSISFSSCSRRSSSASFPLSAAPAPESMSRLTFTSFPPRDESRRRPLAPLLPPVELGVKGMATAARLLVPEDERRRALSSSLGEEDAGVACAVVVVWCEAASWSSWRGGRVQLVGHGWSVWNRLKSLCGPPWAIQTYVPPTWRY